MQIGIFSGSFNPIHLGHTRLTQYIADHAGLDEVWLMVSPNNPLKPAGSLMDEQIRFMLAERATAELPHISASDFEFSLPRPSYTVRTLEALGNAYPEHTFSLIIGSDNMAIFHLWREWETILRDYRIIVYPREGDDLETLEARYPQMEVIEGAPLLDVSATQIRENADDDELLGKWLHPEVKDFLKKNRHLFAHIN